MKLSQRKVFFSVISLSHVCFLLKSCKVDYLRMTVQVDVVLCILASPNDALTMIHISEKSNMLVCSLPTQHHPWISMVRFLWSRKKQMPKLLLVTWLLSGNQRQQWNMAYYLFVDIVSTKTFYLEFEGIFHCNDLDKGCSIFVLWLTIRK